MADENTSLYGLVKPEVGASADTWGGKLNNNFDDLDAMAGALATGGSSNAYTLTTGLSLSALAAGQRFLVAWSHTNTGAATLNVDSLGAKTIKRRDGATNVASGDLVEDAYGVVVYDGTNFVHVGPCAVEVPPLDADLAAIAALGYTSGSYIITKIAADTWALNSISANALSTLAAADYAAMRSLWSLGTAALKNTGTSGDAVGLLNVSNTALLTQIFTGATGNMTIETTQDAFTTSPLLLRGTRATYASGQAIYHTFQARNTTPAHFNLGRIGYITGSLTPGAESATLDLQVMAGGTLAPVLRLTGTSLYPETDDGLALGIAASRRWSDLFGASGFTLNIANGDAVITHFSGVFNVTTGDLRVTTAGSNAQSVVTVGGTQTLTNKTLTTPTISNPTITGDLKRPTPATGIDTTSVGYLGFGAIQSETADFTFALSDAGQLVQQNSASSEVATIPTNAAIAFPIGTAIPVENIGAGTMVLTPDSGVTLLDETGASGSITLDQHDGGVLYKTDTNTWRYRGSHD